MHLCIGLINNTLKFCSIARSTVTCSAALWSSISCLLPPASSPLGMSRIRTHGTVSTAKRALASSHHPEERRGLQPRIQHSSHNLLCAQQPSKERNERGNVTSRSPSNTSTHFLYKMQWKYLLVSLFWHFPPKADRFFCLVCCSCLRLIYTATGNEDYYLLFTQYTLLTKSSPRRHTSKLLSNRKQL